MSNEANSRPTKSQRREQARADAKAARAKQQAKEKRNRRLLQGGVALAILAVIAIVAVVITTSMRPIGPGPKNMASGGAVFGADLVACEQGVFPRQATLWIWFSTGLVSSSSRPSSRNRISPGQRPRV